MIWRIEIFQCLEIIQAPLQPQILLTQTKQYLYVR